MYHIHTEISSELYHDLQELIPYGTKRKVVEVVLRQVVKALRSPDGSYVLGAILNEYLDVVERFKPEGEQ